MLFVELRNPYLDGFECAAFDCFSLQFSGLACFLIILVSLYEDLNF